MNYIRNNHISRLVLSMVVLCALSAVPLRSHAYEVDQLPSADVFGDFVVGPGKMDIELKPGESKTIDLTVANRMGDTRDFELMVEDMKGSDDPAQSVVLMGTDRGPYSLRDYFQFSEQRFTLLHGTRARVPVTITVPADAEPGGYYGSVLVTTVSNKTTGQPGEVIGGAAIVSRIGVLFFVTVPGDTKEEGTLESFGTKGNQSIFTQNDVTFHTLFRNTGDLHLKPSGEIKITNMLGTVVETIEVDPWFALPKSLRLREVTWKGSNLIGRYTAELTLNRGYDNKVDTQVISFWVVPLLPVGVALGAIFFLFFVLRLIATRFEIRRK
jgi:hypothetical protein